MAVSTSQRSPDRVVVPGLYRSIQMRRAMLGAQPDPRFDGIADDAKAEQVEELWRHLRAEAEARARREAEAGIAEGKPIVLMYLPPGVRSDGAVVPNLPLLCEGLPLRVTPDDTVEIDSAATPQRRAEVNRTRQQRGYAPIPDLDLPDWQQRVRRWLAR